jgi:hypothetical protein
LVFLKFRFLGKANCSKIRANSSPVLSHSRMKQLATFPENSQSILLLRA